MMKYGEMSRLTDQAAAEIEGLEAEGMRLTPSEILKLNAVCYQIEHPASRIELARGRPVQVGGAWLWPLTLYGADWFERVSPLFKRDNAALNALIFALAHGREDKAFDFPDAEAVKRVRQWRRTLRARQVEIEEAADVVLRQDMMSLSTGESSEGKPSWGDLSSELTAMLGGNPEVWERHVSLSYAMECLRTIRAQNDADGKSSRHDPRLRANKALAEIKSRIRKRHAKERSNGE